MINQELKLKLKELDDKIGYPAVTLLMPLDNDAALGDPDKVLQDLIKEVKKQIALLPDSPAFQNINKKLNQLPVKLPPYNVYKGLAAFVSSNYEEIIPLEFTVERKAYVGTSFELKDIFRINENVNSNIQENVEEKIKRLIMERYFHCRPYSKRTF